MTKQLTPPYMCHVFVCTNDRGGERESCADHGSSAIRKTLKQEISDRGLKGRVRVSQSGCLGQCEQGPVVVIYPQDIWFTAVSMDDIDLILSRVEELLKDRI